MTYEEFCDCYGVENMRANPDFRVTLPDGSTIVAIPLSMAQDLDYHTAECGSDNVWTVIAKAEDEPDPQAIDTDDDEDLPFTEYDPEADDPLLDTVEYSCVSGFEIYNNPLFFFVTDEVAKEDEEQFTLTFTG